DDREVQLGLEEVPGGEVRAAVLPEQSLGERSRLLDRVTAPLIREGGIRLVPREPELAEQPVDGGIGLVPVPVLDRARERQEVVERPRRAAEAEARVQTPEAPARELGRDLADLVAAPGDEVDGPPQRVAPE